MKEKFCDTLDKLKITIDSYCDIEDSDKVENKFLSALLEAQSGIDDSLGYAKSALKTMGYINPCDDEDVNKSVADAIGDIENVEYHADIVKGALAELETQHEELVSMKNAWLEHVRHLLNHIENPEDYSELRDYDKQTTLDNIIKLAVI